MRYQEEKQNTKEGKQVYLDGLKRLISLRQQAAAKKRNEYCKDIFTEPARYREDMRRMLGWPLIGQSDAELPKVSSEKLSDEDGYTVYRMRFEILDGVMLSGLFFKADGEDKKPLVLVQHGGAGTPELISGMYGSTSNYNDMLQRVRRHGVHVFAAQLLLWHESYGVSYDRKAIDAKLKRVGSSIAAVEIYGLTRILDYFEHQDFVLNFGMVGLSYGGFYTLFTTAIDTRIKTAISCSFYNTRDRITWSDWTWLNSAEKFDDAEVACLIYPRKLCIEIGTNDQLFDHASGVRSFEKLVSLCRDVGTDWVDFISFEGTHEFCKQDLPIERLIKELYK